MKQNWFFIVNAAAGNGKSGKKINTIIRLLNEKQIPFEMELTKWRNHAEELAQQAVKEGFGKIIAVGGDGTLHEIVNGLMQTGENVKLGILPEGGGNDYAKNFSIPHDINQCLEIFLRDKIRKVDVGKIGNQFFINSFGLGFDAKVAYFAQKIRFLNGLPRYLTAVIKAMIHLEHYPMKIILNDEIIEENVLFVGINNGRYSGGGFQLTPAAVPDDGFFDICIAKALSRKEILHNLPAAIRGKHTHLPFVKMRKAKKIEVVSSPVSYYYDGEIPEPQTIEKVEISLLPQQISLLVP
jgi:diacylglycerol kinase (ATP)